VDIRSNPVTRLVCNDIVLADVTVHGAEDFALATGFDAATGGFKDIDITRLGGLTLQERWSDGTHAYLGMAVSEFPNLFYT
jgi:cation diffusion facilitator CzcD-associated flavoprotein CzcO